MSWLKQSTAVTIKMGPFVDDTDGKTAETALTISQADIRLSKNGGAFAQSNNAAGATHDEAGEYGVPLDTTDTNTLGTLKVRISESGALPVWRDFMVVPANVWDSLFGADRLQVHADEITAGLLTSTAFANDAITDAKVASDVTIASVTGAVGSVTGAVGSVTAGVTVTTNNDKTDYTLSAAGIQAIWDALTSALTTVGSVGKLLVDMLNATVSSRATQTSVDDLPTNAELATALGTADDATLAAIAALNNLSAAQVNAEVDAALADYDGPTFAELDARTDAIDAALLTIDDFLDTEIGTLTTNVAAILDDTGTNGVVVAAASKSGYALSATGLDAIPITAPTAVATTFREVVVQVWRRFFKKSTLDIDLGEIKTYADNGSTVITTQTVSDDGTIQTVNAAS